MGYYRTMGDVPASLLRPAKAGQLATATVAGASRPNLTFREIEVNPNAPPPWIEVTRTLTPSQALAAGYFWVSCGGTKGYWIPHIDQRDHRTGSTVRIVPRDAAAAGYEWVPPAVCGTGPPVGGGGHWQRKSAAKPTVTGVTVTESTKSKCIAAGIPSGVEATLCATAVQGGQSLSSYVSKWKARHAGCDGKTGLALLLCQKSQPQVRDWRLDALRQQCIAAGVPADQVEECAAQRAAAGGHVVNGVLVGGDGKPVVGGAGGGAGIPGAAGSSNMMLLLLGGGGLLGYLLWKRSKKKKDKK